MNRLLYIILVAALAAAMPSAAHPDGGKKAKADSVYIGGEVYDSFTKARIKAVVTITSEDSALAKTDTCYIWRTSSSFGFRVPKRPMRYFIRAEAEGYKTMTDTFDLKPRGRKGYYAIPRLLMKRGRDDIYKDVGLNEVVVRGTRVQIAYRGDTIVYDASAFNLPEGSMLDGLIRQMPGVELKDNGDIYVNGKKVDYLLLNGKDFFKGKNKVMLENLPYFTVKNVKVYDKSTEKSEALGREVEAKDFVMDVNLKREYARSYIANAEAGAGTDNRWAARAFGLYFDDHTRVAVFGNANNVNENRQPGSDGDWSPAKMQRGLLSTKQAGLSLQTEDKDKRIKDNFDALVRWNDSDNERHNSVETFASDGNIVRGSSAFNRNKDFNLNINNYLTLPKLHIYSYANLDYTNSSNTSWGRDSTLRDTLTNRSWSEGLGRSRQLYFFGYTGWSQPLPWGDYLVLFADYSYSRRRPAEDFSLTGTQYATDGTTDRRNNYADTRSDSYSYRLGLSYDFALPDNWSVRPGVSYGQNRDINDNARYRLDRLASDRYDELGLLPSTRDSLLLALDADNSAYTNVLTRSYGTHLEIMHPMAKSYVYVQLPLYFRREGMHYRSGGLDTVASRSYTDFEPYAQMEFSKGKNKFELNYRMRVTQPEFQSLMPSDDTTDPLALRINNPDLKAITRHWLGGKATFRCDSIDLTWYAGAQTYIVRNDFGTRTTYNSQTGAYTYIDDNVDGNWDFELNGGLNGTFDKKRRLRYVFDASVKYIHSVDFDVAYDTSADVLSTVETMRTNLNLNLTYTQGKLTAGLAGKLTARNSRSDRQGFEAINAYDYQYGANLKYTIPVLNLDLSTDFNVFSRRGYGSAEMNTDDPVWNAQLSKSFFKGSLVAKLTAYDLLHQLSTKSYSINAQGRTETRYNCIPRYLMFSLAYKFTRKAKQNDKN